ncbi:hypothetical protein Tco_0063899, partial [Tanacetum coccineum]
FKNNVAEEVRDRIEALPLIGITRVDLYTEGVSHWGIISGRVDSANFWIVMAPLWDYVETWTHTMNEVVIQ